MLNKRYNPSRTAVFGLSILMCAGLLQPTLPYSANAQPQQNSSGGMSTHSGQLLQGHVGTDPMMEGSMRLSRPMQGMPAGAQTAALQGAASNNQSALNGADFAAPLRNTNLNGGAANNNLQASATKDAPTYAGLTTVEVHRLTSHDVVLLIDRSGSMSAHDCPAPHTENLQGWKGALASFAAGALMGGSSRWDWCAAEATSLGKVMSADAPRALSVILFSSRFHIFPHVTWSEIPGIFNDNRPGGGTLLGEPLGAALEDYFHRREKTGGHIRPLAIGVITDGCPADKERVAREIIQATQQMQNPREISITFFIIGGRDPEGEEFVWSLDNKLVGMGARYDIVKGIPFNQLSQQGLPKALADSLE